MTTDCREPKTFQSALSTATRINEISLHVKVLVRSPLKNWNQFKLNSPINSEALPIRRKHVCTLTNKVEQCCNNHQIRRERFSMELEHANTDISTIGNTFDRVRSILEVNSPQIKSIGRQACFNFCRNFFNLDLGQTLDRSIGYIFRRTGNQLLGPGVLTHCLNAIQCLLFANPSNRSRNEYTCCNRVRRKLKTSMPCRQNEFLRSRSKAMKTDLPRFDAERFREFLVVGTKFLTTGQAVTVAQRWQESGCHYITVQLSGADSSRKNKTDLRIVFVLIIEHDPGPMVSTTYLVTQLPPIDVIDLQYPPLYLFKVVSKSTLTAVDPSHATAILSNCQSLRVAESEKLYSICGSFPEWNGVCTQSGW